MLFLNIMKVKAYIDKDKKSLEVELEDNATIKDMLKKININPVTVIVSRDNNIILEDENLKDNDKIKLISVISGG